MCIIFTSFPSPSHNVWHVWIDYYIKMEHLPKSLGGLISCWSKKGLCSSSLYSVIRKWLKNFIFRDVWLLSMNNNTLGQICSTDVRGSSCGKDRKIYHLCSQAATPDLKVRSQRTRRYWGKVLVWKHNYMWVFLAWHEASLLGQTPSFWNVLCARLCG